MSPKNFQPSKDCPLETLDTWKNPESERCCLSQTQTCSILFETFILGVSHSHSESPARPVFSGVEVADHIFSAQAKETQILWGHLKSCSCLASCRNVELEPWCLSPSADNAEPKAVAKEDVVIASLAFLATQRREDPKASSPTLSYFRAMDWCLYHEVFADSTLDSIKACCAPLIFLEQDC